jgi:hypothetical protein
MLETGLRVSDAVKFNPAKCQKSKFLWIYSFNRRKAKKTKRREQSDVYLTARLKKPIDACAWFFEGASFRLQSRGQR